MDEIRRFLRYTLPGLATVLIGYISLYCSGAISTVWLNDHLLAKFIGIFVASGALGYLLANLYFSVRWSRPLNRWLLINHKSAIERLGDVLEVRGPLGSPWNLANLTLFDAWAILTHYCISRSKTEEYMGAIVEHTKTMVDVTHGLGALCTGVSLVTLSVLVLGFLGLCSPEAPQIWIVFTVLVILSWALWSSFRYSLKALQAVSNTAFVASVMAEHDLNPDQPVRIFYEMDDA